MDEFSERDLHHRRRGLQEGTATSGACLIQNDIVNATVTNKDALMRESRETAEGRKGKEREEERNMTATNR